MKPEIICCCLDAVSLGLALIALVLELRELFRVSAKPKIERHHMLDGAAIFLGAMALTIHLIHIHHLIHPQA